MNGFQIPWGFGLEVRVHNLLEIKVEVQYLSHACAQVFRYFRSTNTFEISMPKYKKFLKDYG